MNVLQYNVSQYILVPFTGTTTNTKPCLAKCHSIQVNAHLKCEVCEQNISAKDCKEEASVFFSVRSKSLCNVY